MTTAAQRRAQQSDTPRMEFVEGIRCLTATYVVFHHLWQFAVADPGRPPPSWFRVANVFEFGSLGVAVFVVVSGYCLMLPVAATPELRLPGGLLGFARRRTLRIIPPYYAALVFSFVILGLFRELRAPSGTPQDITLPTFTWSKTLSHVLSFHNVSRAWRWGINPPHWTVALEFQIYFVFALVLLPTWRRFGMAVSVGLAFAIGFAFMTGGLGFAAPWMVGLFGLGMIAASISIRPGSAASRLGRVPWGTVSIVGWLMVPVSVVLARKLATGDWETLIPEVIVGIATMSGLTALSQRQLAAGSEQSRVSTFLAWWPIRYLGGISYSTYLVHYPIIAAVAIVWVRHLDLSVPATFAVLSAICWPVILVVSTTFHRLIERPLLHRKRASGDAASR